MSNLARMTYGANRRQARIDWAAIAAEAAALGRADLAAALEPPESTSTAAIDRAIHKLRTALEAEHPDWTFTLPSAR